MQDEFSTPMIKQYLGIKEKYSDCLVLYRMGDFYELFFDDAHVGAQVLDITLTGKANGKGGRIPMAGVPYHAVDSYLSKLVKSGYKVAICEQLSPPNKKGLVERDVVRIVTPGTVLDERSLDKKNNNYIISLHIEKNSLALAVADISTGYFSATEINTEHVEQVISDELARIQPTECIVSETLYNNPQLLKLLTPEIKMNIFPFSDWEIFANDADNLLKEHFALGTLSAFQLGDKHIAQKAAASLLGYLQQTQKGPVKHITKIVPYGLQDYLALDRSTILNLELFTTIRDHDTKATLFAVMDQTQTSMGGRLLKRWMKKPLVEKQAITARHDAVEYFLSQQKLRREMREQLSKILDIERLIARLSVGLGNARDLINLADTLNVCLRIKKMLNNNNDLIKELIAKVNTTNKAVILGRNDSRISSRKNKRMDSGQARMTDQSIDNIIYLIEKAIVPEPPVSIREGRMIQKGINKELDKLREIVSGSRDWILEMEQQERQRTGINSLKVRFNQVFGFYIEVSKANLNLVPATYMRKQTLVNAERYITKELKEQEEIILSAEERINTIEYELFQETVQKVLAEVSQLQEVAGSIAEIDCLVNFAQIAEKSQYVKPEITENSEIRITNGRHPVVETLLKDKQFVPNNVSLNKKQQMVLLTGPNMAGKSVYIRQNALIVLMAQMGSFVPADKASINIADHIFVRSGASDAITSGFSTFMVEMVETAYILHHATEKSLIVMDEIGRGTSTYDGISIAWAVAEYLVKHNASKTLFATHYHELQNLEENYPEQIHNFHMSVAEDQGEPIFLHTLTPGGASHSYGVAVAKLAGLPEEVVTRARELLGQLERRSVSSSSFWQAINERVRNPDSGVVVPPPQNDERLVDHLIRKELTQVDISQMTPLEALNKLAELKEKVKLLSHEDKEYLEAD